MSGIMAEVRFAWPRCAAALGPLLAGCTAVFGLGELSYDPTPTGNDATSAIASGTGGAAASSASAGGSSNASGTGGSSISECWKRGPDDWDDIVKVDRSLLAGGGDATNFQLAADGLRLYYAASTTVLNQTKVRIFLALRGDRNAKFQGGQLLAAWPFTTMDDPPGQPWVDPSNSEMYLHISAAKLYLVRSQLMGVNWSEPVPVIGFKDPGVSYGDPALAAKGTRLFYFKSDGTSTIAGQAYQFYESARATTNDAFSAVTAKPVSIPPIGKADFMFCPSPSEDGNRLFLGSTYPKILDATNLPHATSVYYVERTAPSAPWSLPTHVTKLDSPDRQTCPLSVTADGCELMFEFWTLATGTTDVFIARRVPK
jgi:hypothetical protein